MLTISASPRSTTEAFPEASAHPATKISVARQGCTGCGSGCARSTVNELIVPGTFKGQIELSISLSEQLRVLVNSLLLPLFGFIIGTGFTHFTGATEWIVVSGGMLGLVIGLWSCRTKNWNTIEMNEVSIHEQLY